MAAKAGEVDIQLVGARHPHPRRIGHGPHRPGSGVAAEPDHRGREKPPRAPAKTPPSLDHRLRAEPDFLAPAGHRPPACPDHASFICAHDPWPCPATRLTWASWPQACMAHCSLPSGSVCRVVAALGQAGDLLHPVWRPCRRGTIWSLPGPFLRTPTTPVPPDPRGDNT